MSCGRVFGVLATGTERGCGLAADGDLALSFCSVSLRVSKLSFLAAD